ncbi:sporulation protein YabP [Clostridium sp. CAG:299]|nr:sporulation protein YabP [Clostridium sp. CAG:299]
MEEKISRRPHHLDLMNRGTGSVTGIQDVVAFDENQIVLDTDMGLLTVKGKGLHVSRLTLGKGEVDIEGTVDSLVYSSNETYRKQGESLFARLFK